MAAPAAAEADAAAASAAAAAPSSSSSPPPPPGNIALLRSSFDYQTCYCEENAYLLIKRLVERGHADEGSLYAVFVSNAQKCVPIWRQRAALARGPLSGAGNDDNDQLAVWDYHVFAVQRGSGADDDPSLVYDLDTTIEPFPCTFEAYRSEALRSVGPRRLYRVAPARDLFARFSSDRSHMRTPQGGWTMPPPPWPPLGESLSDKNTLPLFLDMRDGAEATRLGPHVRLLDEAGFAAFFASPRSRRREEDEATTTATAR